MVFDLFHKNSSKENEERRKRNAAILDLALLQRSKIYIQFEQDTTNLTNVTGSILALNTSGLVLELSGITTIKERFVGQPISCFFKIVEREDRHREIFYTFQTTILQTRQLPDKLPQIAIAFPDSLQGTQRRKSLRMRPDLEQFEHIALWKYDASGGFDFNNPSVSFAHFKSNLASIDNISAGGLRISMRKQLLKQQQLTLEKGQRFILFTFFSEKLPRIRREFWLVCKINNIQRDPVSGNNVLGLEFIANGARKEDTGKVEWSKIADNVIDDLAQRIYQWHINLYRAKGLS